MKKPSDNEIMRALVNQVMRAMPVKGTERNVVTFITKPMWNAFLRATGSPISAKPTEWSSGKGCMRVFGSETIVLNSNKLMSVSFSLVAEQPK